MLSFKLVTRTLPVFIFLFLFGCKNSDQSNPISGCSENQNTLNSSPSNPYEWVGVQHNSGLDYVYANLSASDTSFTNGCMDSTSYCNILDIISDYCLTQNYSQGYIDSCIDITNDFFEEAGMFVDINGITHVKPVSVDTLLLSIYNSGYISFSEKQAVKPRALEVKSGCSVSALMDSIDTMPIQDYIDDDMDFALCFISVAQYSYEYWCEPLLKTGKSSDAARDGAIIVADGLGAIVGNIPGGIISSVCYAFYYDWAISL